MSDLEQPVVAIVGVGEMGAAVGKRLRLKGARVRVSLSGRSAESARRVRAAELEIIDDDFALVRDADFVLSIVPPGVAIKVAEQYRLPLADAQKQPIFADCNAVSPATARRIGEILAGCRCRYVDAGIIGGPPPEDVAQPGPRFYASGPHAHEFAKLGGYGLDIAVVDGPIGAASALKLSYAGITKGIIALGTAMIAAAARHGLADELRDELARTQPQILKQLAHQVPAMFPKAYRWVAEMEEIAAYLDGDERGSQIYRGAARLYDHIAAENANREEASDLQSLIDFCTSALNSPPAK